MQLRQFERSATEFTVSYDGNGLADHTMSARDLVLVLSNVDDLVRRSNAVVNRDIATSSLRVRTHRPGSFEVEFLLGVIPVFAAGFGGDRLAYATNLLRLLFGSSAPGLFTLIKLLRGRTPTVTDSSNGNMLVEARRIRVGTIFEAEDFRAEVPAEVYRMFLDPNIRRSASGVISPLQRDGIDRMYVREGDEDLESLTSDDVRAFVVPSEQNILGQTTSRQFLTIETSRFSTRSRQWRFHDGNGINTYRMLDDSFITSVVEGQIAFSAGDIFECEVQITQRLRPTGDIVTDLDILRVFERHIPNGEGLQGNLH